MPVRAILGSPRTLLWTVLFVTLPVASAWASNGLLKVTSFPSGADVVVDGAPTGKKTPTLLLLPEGDHDIAVRGAGDGWEPQTRSVTVARGRNAVDFTLVPILTEGASCWDLNENRQCDFATEDTNGDGRCTPADCRGSQGDPGTPGAAGPPGRDGSSCTVVREADGASIQCEDGSSARVFDGAPGSSGSSLAALATLLGLDPSSIPVPPGAVQPADCASASTELLLGGSPAGEVVGLLGDEEISRLSRFTVAFRRDDAALDPGQLVASQARLQIRARASGGPLVLSGIVTEGVFAGMAPGGGVLYVVVIEPSFARLQRSRGYASLLHFTIPGMLQLVLGRDGLPRAFVLNGAYPTVPLETQYDETDFDFLNRLMEEEGISYFFTTDDVLVVGDENAAFLPGPSLPYVSDLVPPDPATGAVTSLREGAGLVSKEASIIGFDPDAPATVVGSADSDDGLGKIVRFEPDVTTIETASRRAEIELDRARLGAARSGGTSNATDLRAGEVVAISGAGAPFSGNYLVTKVTHVLDTGGMGGCFAYGNAFHAIPATEPFRPPRRTRPPRVKGVLFAQVTAVDPSAYRVKVKFPWLPAEDDSGFLRVAFPPGRKREAFLPEVGDEVIVSFEGGDPRQPVVLGGLWNSESPPPSR